MPTAKLLVNGVEQTVETKPLTLICHTGLMDIQSPDSLTLDYEAFMYHGERTKTLHKSFHYWFFHISKIENFKVVQVSLTPFGLEAVNQAYKLNPRLESADEIRKKGSEATYLLGLLDLTMKMFDQGITRLFIKKPEMSLHPAYQSGLGDFFAALSQDKHNNIPESCLIPMK